MFSVNCFDYKNKLKQTSQNQPSFGWNITHSLKNRAFLSQKSIQKIVEHADSFKIAGTVPKELIEHMPENMRRSQIKELLNGFSNAIRILQQPNDELGQQIRRFISKNESAVLSEKSMNTKLKILNDYISEFQKITNPLEEINRAKAVLSQTLAKAGFDKSNLKYIGSGEFGDVYRLQIQDKSYALKIFKKYHTEQYDNVFQRMLDEVDIDDFKDEMKLHGRFIEPNRALYLQDNFKKSQNVPMYFADLENGGMLSDFIDLDTPAPEKVIAEQNIGLLHTDKTKKENVQNGWVLDPGGQKVINKDIANNRTARKVYSKIAQASEDERLVIWNDMMKKNLVNRNTMNKYDTEKGLMNAIELMPIQSIIKLDIPDSVRDKWIKNSSLSYSLKMKLVNSKLFR